MNTSRSLVTLGVTLALCAGQNLYAAQQEEDSVREWGRWAVLSPAAGGTQPYVAALTPDAANNARPEEAEEFHPEILATDGSPTEPVEPPVEIAGFCEPGSPCGYATYEHVVDDTGTDVTPTQVPDGFDLSDEDPNGPVLARFSLETFAADGETDVQPALSGEGEGGPQGARFSVTETGNENFPDVQSVDVISSDVPGEEGFYFGSGDPDVETTVLNDEGSVREKITVQGSGLQEDGDFGGVDTGFWTDGEEIIQQFISSDAGNEGPPIILSDDFFFSEGAFVHGVTATIEQMESFAAGNVSAIYRGATIGYNSGVTLQFDFGNDTFQGNFASENGFNGFDISGNVQGVNFAATEGSNAVNGSFFNSGANASGAVRNETQLDVFSADHVVP